MASQIACNSSGHYDDVIMTMLASQITSLTVVYSIVHSCVNQRKHQSSASLAFVREIHRGPVNFPHKWPVTRKMFPFDDVIMVFQQLVQGKTSNVRHTDPLSSEFTHHGEFPSHMASHAERLFVSWRFHDYSKRHGSIWTHIYIHYSDVIMGTIASQITSLTIVYSTVYSGTDQRKHQSSASLPFGRWIPSTKGQ